MFTPAGNLRSPSSMGCARCLTTAGTTGRRRRVSLITTSRYSSPPALCSSTMRASTAGSRVIRSSVQLSAELGVGHLPPFLVARREQQREDVVALLARAAGADLLHDRAVGGLHQG